MAREAETNPRIVPDARIAARTVISVFSQRTLPRKAARTLSLAGQQLALVWPHAPWPRGSTRPGMKPNGAFRGILRPSGRSARVEAALSERKNQTGRSGFTDLCETRGLGRG